MMAIISIIIAISLFSDNIYDSFGEALRHATFQVASITTTSGFATADTNTWTPIAVILLIFCTVVCGCAGSTSGGLKVDRLVISAKVIRNRIKIQQHPNAVLRVKVGGVVQDNATQSLVTTFVIAYILLTLIGTFVYTLFGCDLETGFTATIACISNVGPGFGDVGSLDNYSNLPAVLKFTSTALMLIGRLEIFGFLQIFFLNSWK